MPKYNKITKNEKPELLLPIMIVGTMLIILIGIILLFNISIQLGEFLT